MQTVRAAATLALAAAIWVPAVAGSDSDRSRPGLSDDVTVMTRNLYLGTDLFPIFRTFDEIPPGASQTEVAETVAARAFEARRLVDLTDFRRRAGVIADEIVAHEPDLVGLQEVALWRSGPLELDRMGVPNAFFVDYDFEAILMAAIEARDADYHVAVRLDEADIEVPSVGPDGETPRDIRITLRDVVLVKDGVEVLDAGAAHYRDQYSLRAPGPDIELTRGYEWVDVDYDGGRFRFINTHLEVRDSLVGFAQARELTIGPGSIATPVIVVCDCNSDPLRLRRSAAYRALTSAGFTDQWLTLANHGPGDTCCVDDALAENGGPVLDSRVDFVFAKAGQRVRAEDGALLGHPSGVPAEDRASDHAGVVLTIRSVDD
jgi:endonuclease/exonuclease/phosphatase family metal-dependent hydrolase